MYIRRMTRDDAVSVTRIHRNTIRTVNSKDYSKKDIAAWSGRISARWLRTHFDREIRFVALEDDQIIGFMAVSKDKKTLTALYVRQGYIGRGVGRALFVKAEKIIRDAGHRQMTVESTLTARSFYERNGMKVIQKTTAPIAGRNVPIYKMKKIFS